MHTLKQCYSLLNYVSLFSLLTTGTSLLASLYSLFCHCGILHFPIGSSISQGREVSNSCLIQSEFNLFDFACVTGMGSLLPILIHMTFSCSLYQSFVFILQGSQLVQSQAVIGWIGWDDPRKLCYRVFTPSSVHHGNQGCCQTSFHAVSWMKCL